MTQHAQKYQNEGLEDAANRYGVFCDTRSEFERYVEEKHLVKPKQAVAPYTPPEAETEQDQPVVTLTMKRWGIGGSFTAAVYCVCALVDQGAFRMAGAVLGWIVLPAAGIGVGYVILKSCFAWTPSAETKGGQSGGQQSGGGGNNYNQWNQYNNFGGNPNQNNQK